MPDSIQRSHFAKGPQGGRVSRISDNSKGTILQVDSRSVERGDTVIESILLSRSPGVPPRGDDGNKLYKDIEVISKMYLVQFINPTKSLVAIHAVMSHKFGFACNDGVIPGVRSG
ncbi:hypothetical protein G5I_12554 [Acromyrmex echinatior]|uniref:Uncharacterized protein n=1 Tax=Acromyrmex echinatior TaxID=103372 RepID=F4X2M4_ACREC|nr:hypothetical protein G5I_12554 [Acromyrmex echinatior]